MKKMFMSLLLVAATMNAMAALTYTAKANLKIGECEILLRQSDELTQAENSYWAPMMMEGRNVALYAWVNNTEYQRYFVKDLEGVVIGVYAKTAGTLTISASNVEGADMYLIDTEDGNKSYKIANGDVVTINAAAGASNNRFKLTLVAPAPAVPGICHQNGKLEFTAYKGASVQVVEYDDNTKVAVAATDITLDYQEIDLAALAAGQYLVIVTKADQTKEELVIKK